MLTGLPPQVPKEMIEQLFHNMLVVLTKRNNGFLKFTVQEIDEAIEQVVMESDPVDEVFTLRLVPKKEKGH